MAKKASKKRKKSRALRTVSGRQLTVRKKKVRKAMSDKPKPWPYDAGRDRDEAAEEAQEVMRHAKAASEQTSEVPVLKALNRIMELTSNILRRLERHGAKTRPKDGGGV